MYSSVPMNEFNFATGSTKNTGGCPCQYLVFFGGGDSMFCKNGVKVPASYVLTKKQRKYKHVSAKDGTVLARRMS